MIFLFIYNCHLFVNLIILDLIKNYVNLFARASSKNQNNIGLENENKAGDQLNSNFENLSFEITKNEIDKAKFKKEEAALYLVQKCYIWIGDLLRYKIEINSFAKINIEKYYREIKKTYLTAKKLNPFTGKL